MSSAVLILLPMILPLAAGFFVIEAGFKDDLKRNIFIEAAACLTALLVFCAIFLAGSEPVTIFSFTRGFSVTFRMDRMAALFAGMISLMWPLVLLYAFSYMAHDPGRNSFLGFYLMTYGITLGVALSADLITLYVFFEMLTLVTLPLVAHYRDHESMYAGRLYAAYTIGGASLAFIPVVMITLRSEGGTFIYGGAITQPLSGTMISILFLFGFFGFGVKAALFPLHGWLPKASVAPTPVTALLHAVAVVNSGVFSVMRITYYSFGADILRGSAAQDIAVFAAAFTMVFAAVMALKERHFKRRLAYSTVSNLSYMLFGTALMTPAGFLGGLSHMVFHSVIKMSLFLCAGAFMHVTGKEYIYEVDGVGRKMPVTFGIYTAGALSLTGIPLFCGFISKWQLFTAGASAGTKAGYVGVAALLISAFLCAMYTLTISIRAFFPQVMNPAGNTGTGTKAWTKEEIREADALMLIPMLFFAALNILIGIFPGPVMGFLGMIANGL